MRKLENILCQMKQVKFFLGQIPEKHVFLCTFLDFVTLSPFENMYIILACLLAVYPLDGILKMDLSLEFTNALMPWHQNSKDMQQCLTMGGEPKRYH